jgi:hypothetical protein
MQKSYGPIMDVPTVHLLRQKEHPIRSRGSIPVGTFSISFSSPTLFDFGVKTIIEASYNAHVAICESYDHHHVQTAVPIPENQGSSTSTSVASYQANGAFSRCQEAYLQAGKCPGR